MLTDNNTTETDYHNGKSSSPEFFELFIRFRILELYHGLKLHLLHVAGTRMTEQGTYGVSQGNQLEGVLRGVNMLNFLPIHKSLLC